MLGEAGLAAHDARPRPRQTEARRRHPVGGHPGSGQGSRRHGPHPDRGRAELHQDAAAYTLPGWRSRSPPLAPMKRAGQHQGVASGQGHDAVRQPEPQDRRVPPEGANLRRRWGCLSRGDPVRLGRRRWGIATGRVRTDRWGSGGVSGDASTDHPFGTPGHNPRADDRRGTTDCRLRRVMPLPASGTICHLTCRGPSPHG